MVTADHLAPCYCEKVTPFCSVPLNDCAYTCAHNHSPSDFWTASSVSLVWSSYPTAVSNDSLQQGCTDSGLLLCHHCTCLDPDPAVQAGQCSWLQQGHVIRVGTEVRCIQCICAYTRTVYSHALRHTQTHTHTHTHTQCMHKPTWCQRFIPSCQWSQPHNYFTSIVTTNSSSATHHTRPGYHPLLSLCTVVFDLFHTHITPYNCINVVQGCWVTSFIVCITT